MQEADSFYDTYFFQKNIDTEQYDDFVLGADVGGTTSNIAIAGRENNIIELLFSLDFNTKKLISFHPALKKALLFAKEEYGIKIRSGCIGAAGIVSADHSFVDLTNISWNINAKDLLKKTALNSLFILNDFQILGYSLNTIDITNENDVIIIRKGSFSNHYKTQVLLGAGTGLGKTVIRYDNNNGLFHAFESEGGHGDIPVYTDFEFELVKAIRQKKHPQYPVTYEDILSGDGLVEIYLFLQSKKDFKETSYTQKIDQSQDKASLISKYRLKDACCKETFQIFRQFFARCAKNIALETLSFGGVFIAGGIAVKNKDVFLSNEFKTEFNQGYTRSNFLKKIPIYLLSDYYLSLKGACFAAAYQSIILSNQNKREVKSGEKTP